VVSFTFTGIKPMQNACTGLATTLNAKAGAGLYQQGRAVMERSKASFVPVKTGALRASGRTVGPERQGNTWVVQLIYGGPGITYALEQHETPWYQHPVGQWKYLETPMKEAAGEMAAGIAGSMLKGHQSGGSGGRGGFGFGPARVT
jgi:hypothetical protein